MSNIDNSKATPNAIKNANETWVKFLSVSKFCMISIAVALILMALFLV